MAANLFYMKQFYLGYPGLLPKDGILHAASGESVEPFMLLQASLKATGKRVPKPGWGGR